MLTPTQLQSIAKEGNYDWIKVKKIKENDDSDDPEYWKLLIHHRAETVFLINKCRELAKQLLDTEKGL